MELIPTIGLEIHVELKTATKMFCSSQNAPEVEAPNVHICPVCLSHPGTLPTINGTAVRHVLLVGKAIGATLADYTEFDRKNYFYPDLPKGYQLSQYEFPLVSGGSLCGVDITRIHLEEDTARSIHDTKTGATLVDYNRAGVPLMELVTEPVIHSAEDAGKFARELQLLLRYLGVSDANMEKGQMRVEANISIAPPGQLGTKVEVKNLNSFRSMERAILFEVARHKELLAAGKAVQQETRGWDEGRQLTFAQRIKEGSADYRYFPDPDLPKIKCSEVAGFAAEALVLGELPDARRARYQALGITAPDADFLTREPKLAKFFDEVLAHTPAGSTDFVRLATNYLTSDVVSLIRDIHGQDADIQEKLSISAENFAFLIGMISSQVLSSRGAKDTLRYMFSDNRHPEAIATEHGLIQKGGEDELRPLAARLVSEHPEIVAEYKQGKEKILQFLVGKAMKETKGSANPGVVLKLLTEEVAKV